MLDIGRRKFITLLGSAAAWPLAARAQQSAIPVIGFLSSLSAPVTTKRISSFGQGLSELGYTVGRDATVEAHIAEGQYDRLPALAADLVSRRVQLIAASGPPAAFAQQQPMPVIGFLNSGSPAEWAHLVTSFKEGLNELVAGNNASVGISQNRVYKAELSDGCDDLIDLLFGMRPRIARIRS